MKTVLATAYTITDYLFHEQYNQITNAKWMRQNAREIQSMQNE